MEIKTASNFKLETKFSRTDFSLLITHSLNEVVKIFISTFLISYIYSLSSNYVVDIGLFYFSDYFVMAFTYLIISCLIERTNRVSFYRIAIFIRAVFILCVVFLGNRLAGVTYLAGALNGFSDGLYWTSYNVMKNELISNKKVKKYSTSQLFMEKAVNLIVPIVLGSIIDAESFKSSAIIVFVIAVIQMITSIFIKSVRPKNASFDMKGFIKNIKNLGERKSLVTDNIINGAVYGFFEMLIPINTIIIMIGFDSNFSLGIFTSIASVLTIFFLLYLNKFTRAGKRNAAYWISSIVPIIAAYLMIFFLNKVTIIIFSFVYTIFNMFRSYLFDVFRNNILKKLNMYDDIVEFQCSIEFCMEMGRSFVFLVMIIVGSIGSIWGVSGILASLKVLLGVEVFIFPILNYRLYRYERKLIKYDLI